MLTRGPLTAHRDPMLDKQVTKMLGTSAARDDARAVAQLNLQAPINPTAGDDLIEVHDRRSMHTTEVLWIESPFELTQGNVDEVGRLSVVYFHVVIGAHQPGDI